MASRRELKKDLNWLTHEVIADCLIYLDIKTPEDERPIADIISKMVVKREEIISKINKSTSKMERKEVRKIYGEIVKNILETSHSCFEDLSELSKA
jgi:predicted HAD superfamily phosphohydrolase